MGALVRLARPAALVAAPTIISVRTNFAIRG